jgi:DNA-binding CsgD family transcriptional regulator
MPTTISAEPRNGAPAKSKAAALPAAAAAVGEAPLLDLVGAIYDGVHEQKPWERALRLLRRQTGASWVALMLRPASATQAALVVTAGGAVSLPAESPHLNANDIPPGGVFCELEPGRVQRVGPFGPGCAQHLIGADLLVTPSFRARLRIARGAGGGAFDTAEMALVQALLPHFGRAMRSHEEAVGGQMESRLLRSAVDSLCLGVVILGESGEIIYTNSCADKALQERHGIAVVKGTIRCNYPRDDRKLWGAIRMALAQRFDASRGAGAAVAASRDDDGNAWLSMLVRPIAPGPFSCGGKAAAVAIYIRRSDEERDIPPGIISEVFGLTRTEAALALEIAEGATMDEAAAAMDIRRNTARTHLRSIFAKLGVRRQTELMRLVLNSVATMV